MKNIVITMFVVALLLPSTLWAGPICITGLEIKGLKPQDIELSSGTSSCMFHKRGVYPCAPKLVSQGDMMDLVWDSLSSETISTTLTINAHCKIRLGTLAARRCNAIVPKKPKTLGTSRCKISGCKLDDKHNYVCNFSK